MIRPFLAVRGPILIMAGGLFLAFLSAVGTVLATWSSREVALREWEQRLTSVSRMLSAHASQSIGAADLVLRSIADNVSDYRVQDDEELRWVFGSRNGYDLLRESAKALPQIDVVTIASRDGSVINFTREFPPPPINLLDRDYFQAHLADPALDFFLSRPVQNRGNGDWTFYLARKIRSPSGEMLGLVLTGIHATFFRNFYESLGLGLDRVSLLRADGSVLARHWLDEQPATNENKAIVKGIRDLKRGSLLISEGLAAQPHFSEMAAFDVAPNLPIAVSIAASREQVLREWEREAVKFVIEGGSMTGILMAATMILMRLIRQLEAARNAALSAMEAKMRFASNVSHELRTPMNAIIGGSHQLMQTGLLPDSQKFAQIVSSAAQQLMVLINDILDFSYYEARNFRIEPAPFNIRAMAGSAIGMARSVAHGSSVEITCKVSERTPDMALGDSGRICQVLLNLLSNAVKYTECGTITLDVDYKDQQLILVVTDTGRGISNVDSERIFQPFERGDSVSGPPGTGLGLTISKQLVEAMGGAIELQSSLGWGARFTIRLPLPEASAASGANPAAAPSVHARSLNVLVAEDVAPSRILLTLMLEKMGHCVTTVENGREAVAKAGEMKFDLVLMDIQMPELDGVSATRLIRDMEGEAHAAHIIAVSANADLDRTDSLFQAGFNDTLLKPVTPARLDFVIANLAAR